MLLLLDPSNVVMVVSVYSVVGCLDGGGGCYACKDGVEMARDERCCEYAGDIEVGRWEKAVSIQTHIRWGLDRQKMEQTIGSAMSIQVVYGW